MASQGFKVPIQASQSIPKTSCWRRVVDSREITLRVPSRLGNEVTIIIEFTVIICAILGFDCRAIHTQNQLLA